MASAHDDPFDDTSSSLGDSSYEFIDERSNASTDYDEQDAMTESTTSSDEHGFDQADVPLHRPSSNEQTNQPSQGHKPASQEKSQDFGEPEAFSSSRLEVQNTAEEIPHSPKYDQPEIVQFEEPSVINLNSSRFSEVSHTLQIIDKHDRTNAFYSNIFHHLPGKLAVTVRQTMIPRGLTLQGGSYKVLYVGDPANREPVVQKIGTALAASLQCSSLDSEKSRSSKFNIVPISGFGESTTPEVVLIDSSGLELHVEECCYASFARKDDGNDTLHLEMADGTSVDSAWTGSRFALSNNWRLPDLAIFCVSDDDNPLLKQTRQFARSLMSRHAVQSIVTSQTPQWDHLPREHITLDYLTPHICLESRLSDLGPSSVIRRSPIDLATFLALEAGQMNRNLACLAVACGPQKPRAESLNNEKLEDIVRRQSFLWDVLASYLSESQMKRLESLQTHETISRLALCLLIIISSFVLGTGLSGAMGASKVSNSRVFPSIAISTTTQTSIPPLSLTTSALAATTLSSAPDYVPPSKSSSTNTDIASFLLDAYVLAPNMSQQFKVHVLGDRHIVLRPPYWFSKMKNPPKLSFKVLHDSSELDHQLTTLFDGVYALQIPHEDAYGLLNVSIWTESKPRINENFEVDFGSSWLKVIGWKKATRALTESIRDDLNLVKTSLSSLYDHTRTGLPTFVKQQRKKTQAQREAEKAVIRAHLKNVVKNKELIAAQTRDLARGFSARIHGNNAAISKLIRATASQFTKDLSVYTYNKTSMLSKQASVLARAATGVNLRAVAQKIGGFRRRHLRETQKLALKTWWKAVGLPKQKMVDVKATGRGISHRRKDLKSNEV